MRFAFMALALVGCGTDVLEPPTGRTVEYSVTGLSWAANYKEAQENGLDINGDRTNDNLLGQVFSTISARRIDTTGDTGALIASGKLRLAASLQYAQDSDPADSIAFSTSVAGAAASPPLIGWHTDAPLSAGPGELDVAFAFCGEVVTIPLGGARVRIDHADDSTMTGVIAGGVRKASLDTVLAPALARRLNAQVALECTDFTAPDCGCIHTDVEYEANYWLDLFDAPPHKDCVITVDEIVTNSLILSLTTPDVTIDGHMMLSVGFGFEATR